MAHDSFHTPKSAARNYRNDHKYRADVHVELFRQECAIYSAPTGQKKRVVDLVYDINKTSENIRRIKRQLVLFHTVINNVSPFP